MSVRESFNPESYELDKNFRLTRFAELKGTGCKVRSQYEYLYQYECIIVLAYLFILLDIPSNVM